MSGKIKNKQLIINSPFDINEQRLINVANPVGILDAVNKNHFDTYGANQALGTGLYSGGMLSRYDDTHFNIAAGSGFFVDQITKEITPLVWSSKTNIPIMSFGPSDVTISIGLDINGNVVQQIPRFTSSQRHEYINIGEIMIDPLTRVVSSRVGFFPVFCRDIPTVVDLAMSTGPRIIDGNTVSPSGATLSLNVSSGHVAGYSVNALNSYENPNESTLPDVNHITMINGYFNGVEYVYIDGDSVIDVGHWSNGTTNLQVATNNKFNIKILYRGVATGAFFLMIYLTQTQEYSDLNSAKASLYAQGVPIPSDYSLGIVPLCYIISKGNCTDLSNTNDSAILPIQGTTATSSSGSLSTTALSTSYTASGAVSLTATNVEDALTIINNKIESFDVSSSNMNMSANTGSTIFLATNSPILGIPATRPRVEVNGVPVFIGNGVKTSDCFFSNDGGVTAKTLSTITQGDYLYWNNTTASYNLELDDKIDIIYYIIS